MKIKHTLCGLLLVATVLAFQSAPIFAQGKNEHVVVIVPNLAFPFFAFMKTQAEDEGKQLGIQVTVEDGQGKSPTQSSEVRTAVTQGVDGIVPIPHVGADNVAGGVAMAEYVIKKFPNGARIIFLRGEPGSSPAIDRAKGTLETLKAAGDKYKVLADQTANFKRDQGMTVTQNLLTSIGTPPDVIICSNDDMALGAEEALQQAGIPKGKVLVIGFDALPEALAKIRSGDQTATIEQSPGKQVRTALEIIVDHIRKKTPLHDEVIKPFLVDQSNLDKAERIAEAK